MGGAQRRKTEEGQQQRRMETKEERRIRKGKMRATPERRSFGIGGAGNIRKCFPFPYRPFTMAFPLYRSLTRKSQAHAKKPLFTARRTRTR